MAGRPRLPLNTTGEIRTRQVGPKKWKAIANHRDADGHTRQYERSGPSAAAAKSRLKKDLADKAKLAEGRGTIHSGSLMSDLAADYFAQLEADVARDECSPGTLRLYRGHWDNHGAPALGGLTLREADVQVLDRFLLALRERSPTVAKAMRAVLSGMMGLAVRYKALATNPVRDVSRIRGTTKTAVALEPGQAIDLLGKLAALARMPGKFTRARFYRSTLIDPYLPDLVLWMLGTSLRISQALAVHWPAIDMAGGVAAVGPNIIRVKGEELRLNRGTSKTKEVQIGLPSLVVAMLIRRRQETLNPLGPVFPDRFGGLRDPHNTLGDLRRALDMAGYRWVTSHVFRKTVATVLDDAGLSARHIADQLSHARPSMTQDNYLARRAINPEAVAAIEAMLATAPARTVLPLDQPS